MKSCQICWRLCLLQVSVKGSEGNRISVKCRERWQRTGIAKWSVKRTVHAVAIVWKCSDNICTPETLLTVLAVTTALLCRVSEVEAFLEMLALDSHSWQWMTILVGLLFFQVKLLCTLALRWFSYTWEAKQNFLETIKMCSWTYFTKK